MNKNKQGGYECHECGAKNLKPDQISHQEDFYYSKVNICIDCNKYPECQYSEDYDPTDLDINPNFNGY